VIQAKTNLSMRSAAKKRRLKLSLLFFHDRSRDWLRGTSQEECGFMRIIGPNFSVVLRLRGGVVAEAARPVSYMKGWRVERVLALAERWGWKVEASYYDEEQEQTAGQQSGRALSRGES
jgi:hypothetical protein